ncbi:MAG: hypothetical protein EAY70_03440 [Sphingomonadales bacterium]|nr:MAG: hypothetical protein EAY70_03440 [Sphingomonadales bacterium]
MNRTATHHPEGAARAGHSWQLILADLALILFLLTLSTLPAAEAETGQRLTERAGRGREAPGTPQSEVGAGQALFRPVPGGPSLGAWLAGQASDPRATLTVVATHAPGREADAWARAQALAAEVRARGTAVRVIITTGTPEDVYASLAYDTRITAQQDKDSAS